jgi:hypothetical protein
MKKKLYVFSKFLVTAAVICAIPQKGKSQAAVTCTPAMTYACSSGDYINAFVLNGTSAVGNTGCNGGTNNYTLYPTPVWNLAAGNTYTWSSQTNGPGGNQSFSIWIDLNNDGFYTSNEQVANDPSAANHSGSFTIPTTITAANNVHMRLRCRWSTAIGTGNSEACAGYSWGETEDYYVNLIPPTPCSAAPASNSVVVPNYSICPNTGTGISLATSYTESGIAYQWYSSTQSSLGVYNAITTGTNASLSSGALTQNTWYQVVITCTNATSNASINAVNLVQVSPVIVDSVPYLETFEGITANNMLPNCSWSATSLPTISQTYTISNSYNRFPHSGNNFASFRYGTGTGGQFFYSNGVYLQAGITYSAGAWYVSDGYLGWQEFSVFYNTTQTSTGLTKIASKTGAITNTTYQLLSDTFSVPSTGVYYLAVKARDDGSPWYLTWDDLFVNIPCQFNSPNISAVASKTVTCDGEVINLSATGANSYLWSTGDTGNTISYTVGPVIGNNPVNVTGTSSLSGCNAMASLNIKVNPAPQIAIVPSASSVCPGSSANLVAVGANTYTWNDLTTNPVKTVKPNTSTLYSVIGTNNYGCQDQTSYMLTVFPSPLVLTGNSPTFICVGETAKLEANGAISYQWNSNNSSIFDNPAYVSPQTSTSYTVIGTDANGCTDSELLALTVDACVGLKEVNRAGTLKIYPTPSTGQIHISRNSSEPVLMQITDVTGRVVLSENTASADITIDIRNFARGVYYVQMTGHNSAVTGKIIKE